MIMAVSASLAETATLAWDENKETDLAGYIVYHGAASGDYSFSMDVGNTTQYAIQNLDQGVTYYIAVSAYDEDGNESDLSEELVTLLGFRIRIAARASLPSHPALPSDTHKPITLFQHSPPIRMETKLNTSLTGATAQNLVWEIPSVTINGQQSEISV